LHRHGAFQDKALPDVILLDLKLPKKDGHEVLAEIKGDDELRLIPVVILTTSDAEVDRLRAYRLSVNSYLVKPLDAEQFDDMIRDLSLYWATWNRGPHGA
jgi:CheY-like chemotaxis protein